MREIAQNKTEVMTYLKHAVDLEGNIYTAERICESLRSRAAGLAIPREIEAVAAPNETEVVLTWLGKSWKADIITFFIFLLVGIGIGNGTAFLLAIFMSVMVAALFVAYGFSEDYSEQKKRYAVYYKEMRKEEERIKAEEKAKAALLKEAENISEKSEYTKKILAFLYSMNVIYPKYRNFIAVAQFLEYLESGRRDCLGGVNGAYDLYEQERFQNMIIERLDRISSQLGMLQRTQNVLYQEINRTNTLVSGLESEIQNTNLTLQGIQNTAAITAYNSMVVARETGARDYINYYM